MPVRHLSATRAIRRVGTQCLQNPSFAGLCNDHGDHVTCILDYNNPAEDLDSLPMTSCYARGDHIINSINIYNNNNDDIGIVTPPYVSGDQVTNGNDLDCDSFVEDHDRAYMSLPSIDPFPCFACIAQICGSRAFAFEEQSQQTGSRAFARAKRYQQPSNLPSSRFRHHAQEDWCEKVSV
jgi:hypothetical protein